MSSLGQSEVNLLIHRYMVEAGMTHSAYVFDQEAQASGTGPAAIDVPGGSLVSLLQKGLQFAAIEADVDEKGHAVPHDGTANLFRRPATRIVLTESEAARLLAQDRFVAFFMSEGARGASVLNVAWSPVASTLAASAEDGTVGFVSVAGDEKADMGPASKRQALGNGAAAAGAGSSASAAASAAAAQPSAGGAGRKRSRQEGPAASAGAPLGPAGAAAGEGLRVASSQTFRFAGASSEATSVSWLFDGRSVLSSSLNGQVRWSSPSGDLLQRVQAMQSGEAVVVVRPCPTGMKFLACGALGGFAVWEYDIEDDDEDDEDSGSAEKDRASKEEQEADAAQRAERAKITAATNKHGLDDGWWIKCQERKHHSKAIMDCSWADELTFATCSLDHTIQLCRVGNERPVSTLRGHEDVVNSVAYDPSGSVLASASDDCTVRLWSAKDQHIHTFTGHTKPVFKVRWAPPADADGSPLGAISPEGAHRTKAPPVEPWVVSASFDHTARIYDAYDLRCTSVLEGHKGVVYGAAFSPDCRLVATVGGDAQVVVWDVRQARPVRVAQAQGGLVDVAFSASGHALALAKRSDQNLRTPGAVLLLDLRDLDAAPQQ